MFQTLVFGIVISESPKIQCILLVLLADVLLVPKDPKGFKLGFWGDKLGFWGDKLGFWSDRLGFLGGKLGFFDRTYTYCILL